MKGAENYPSNPSLQILASIAAACKGGLFTELHRVD